MGAELKRVAILCSLLGLLLLGPCSAAQNEHQGHETRQEASHEGEGEHHGQDWTMWKWANFAVLVGALGYFMYKKAGSFFRSRTEEIQRSIEEATRLKKEAEERVAEAEARLARLAAEVENLRRESSKEMAAESDRLRREAEQQMAKIQAQAEQGIVSAAKASRQELKAYSAEIALELAERKIRGRLTPDVDQSLINSFVADLDRRSSGSEQDREPS